MKVMKEIVTGRNQSVESFGAGQTGHAERSELGQRGRAERLGGDVLRTTNGLLHSNDTVLEMRYGDRVRMSEWVSIHGLNKVLNDQEYVLELASEHELQEDNLAAERFEELFIEGVNIGGWLGDVSGDRDAYQARAQQTGLYDDIAHRLDAVIDLDFREPIKSEDDEDLSLLKTTIGVDVTVSGSPQVILDKITKHYSDRAKLPFGFSHLDYYARGEQRQAKLMVPRYVIGLSAREVQEIWRGTETDDQQAHSFRPNSPLNLQTRFKVLSEIRAQNLLYYAMLPDQPENRMVQVAGLQISAVDECLNAALKDCTQQIIKRQVLPASIFRAAKQPGARPRRDREIIEEYLMQESQRKYRNRDPFTRIIAETRRLLGALYDEDSTNVLQQDLLERNQIMNQNRALRFRS